MARTTIDSIDLADDVLELLAGIRQTLDHFVGDWKGLFNSMPDYRQDRANYTMAEVILSAVMMYILKQGSRHQMNQDRSKGHFARNYKTIFDCRLLHMDTVSDVMKQLPTEFIEQIRQQVIKFLLKKRTLHKFRLFDEYFTIAIDATGVFNFEEEPYRTSKHRKKTFHQNVLESKIICSNGFSLSIETEWLTNTDGHEKQDCELNAMKRLVKNLKTNYPRLHICVVLDGLYANS